MNAKIEPFELAIIARGTARLTIPELGAMRKQPPAGFSAKLSPLFLKHSDEQTLAALAALYRAKNDFGLDDEDFGPWAVVSISRYMGRGAFANLSEKYRHEGAWGISVQVVPHRTAHSVSGTISLALGLHGPAIGANGGCDGENTGLLALVSIMQQRTSASSAEAVWRGAWLVCSAWSPELSVDQKGEPTSDSTCVAAALALVNADQADERNAIGYLRFTTAEARAPSSTENATALIDHIFDDDHRATEQRIWQRVAGGSNGGGVRVEMGLTVPVGVSS